MHIKRTTNTYTHLNHNKTDSRQILAVGAFFFGPDKLKERDRAVDNGQCNPHRSSYQEVKATTNFLLAQLTE